MLIGGNRSLQVTCQRPAVYPSLSGKDRRALCIGMVAACSGAWAQPSKERPTVRVGLLWTGPMPEEAPTLLEKMLRDLSGPARQVNVETRYGTGAVLQRHTRELVAGNVDLIVANGTQQR